MPVSTPRVVYLLTLQFAFFININQVFAETTAETSVQTPTEIPTDIKSAKAQTVTENVHSLVDEKHLLARLGNIKTVSTSFVQKLYTTDSNEPQITEGILLVAGGDKFRLEYTKPYEQIYVANGKEFLFYDVDLEQITIKPQSEELANTPAMILSNPAVFIKNYYVKLNPESSQEEYILSAKDETSAYNKILLSFKNTRLSTMLIEDSFGQETELNFKSMVYNKKIPDSTFNFKPPAGVDVIRSTAQENMKIKTK